MSGRLRAVSLMLFAVGLAHSGLGELLIFRRMGRAQRLPSLAPFTLVSVPLRVLPSSDALTRQTLRSAWHTPTILGFAFALILRRYANLSEHGAAERFTIRTLAIALALCAVVWFAGTRGKHPGWAAFLVIAALCWVAAREDGD
jgi:hypothetical protein